jgi:hypothetical protein
MDTTYASGRDLAEAAVFVDPPLWASLLGDQLKARHVQLRTGLPIRRVVQPSGVGALAETAGTCSCPGSRCA